MLSCGANVVILSFGANVIIWCYHVMLSSGMITPPFLFFLKTSLTPISLVFQAANHKSANFSPARLKHFISKIGLLSDILWLAEWLDAE
jgi:hypothetical protein